MPQGSCQVRGHLFFLSLSGHLYDMITLAKKALASVAEAEAPKLARQLPELWQH